MSRLGWINFLVFQWLGFRLAREERIDRQRGGLAVSTVGILGPVLPLTGWWSDYVPRNPTMRRPFA